MVPTSTCHTGISKLNDSENRNVYLAFSLDKKTNLNLLVDINCINYKNACLLTLAIDAIS